MTEPHPPSDLLQLRLTGLAQLQRGSRLLVLERKAAAALAWLALRGPVPRERLAALLWPAASAEAARNSLRQLIFKLKKAMDTAVIEGQDELRLPAGLQLDLSGDSLLDGCPFDDCPDLSAWLDETRRGHQQQQRQRRLAAADEALARGDAEQALRLAQAVLADDELSEPAHQRLVQALYLHGERAAALEAAARAERLLQDGLGVPLSAAMQELVALVRRADGPAAARPAIPVAVLRPPHLIGRDPELALLAQARRDGLVALVAGEPGLGKSRLLAEVAAGVPGLQRLGARPGDAPVPFAALARWLRTLLQQHPSLAPGLPPALLQLLPERAPAAAEASRLDLRSAMAGLLGRARAQGLAGLALDDLHHADEASVETLQALIDEPELAGLHWLLARRPAEGGAALDRLAQLLADEGRLLPLALQALDLGGVQALLASLALPGLDADTLAPELLRRTGGNPLFVLETLKALLLQPDRGPAAGRGLPQPASVAALITRRLGRLSAPAQALARVAALAGPDFSTDLAMHVLQVPLMALADAWAELEAAQVLRDSAFAHDLIYEATLASVPAAIRRHARRAIAEFLAPRDAEPARLAEHWLAAGETHRAAPLFLQAGRRAEAAARYAEARGLFERAADCHDAAGQQDQALETRLALADLLMEARDHAASQAVIDGLQAQYRRADDRALIGLQQVHLHTRQSQHAQAVARAQALLADEALCEELTAFRLATVRHRLATSLLLVGRAPEALTQLQLAEPALATTDDPSWRCWFHSQHAMACSQIGEIDQARQAQALALTAARQVGRKRMIAGVLQNSATLATAGGQLLAALELLDECLLLMVEAGGDDHFTLHVRAQRGRVLAWLGRYAEAIEVLEPLTADDSALEPVSRQRSAIVLAETWAALGQPARARRVLPVLAADEPSLLLRNAWAQARCEIAWLAGEPHDDLLQAACALEGDTAPHRAWLLAARAQPLALDLAELAGRRTRWAGCGLAGQVLVADVLAAQAAWQRGDGQAAAQWAARALPALRHSLLPGIYRPWLLLEIARAAAAEPALARRALQEGADWIHGVARFQLPEPLRDGFLRRNRINAELLALAAPPGGR